MRSYKLQIVRGRDLPLRVRPWFILFTVILMVLLGLLGFTNLSHSVPLNDKILHFVCMGSATGVFYFIFDVDEDARRVWFWRYAGLMCTFVLCFLCGGILSEFVQSMLPYKTFQSGDVYANLLGSTCGLLISYNLERYYRHRREIARLYTPLDPADPVSDSESDDEDELATLPTHTLPLYQSRTINPQSPVSAADPRKDERRLMANVWDSREELFAVGGDEEDEDDDEGGGAGYRSAGSGRKSPP